MAILTNVWGNPAMYSLPWAFQLVVVVRRMCLDDPKSYAGRGSTPGRFNCARLVEGEMPDKGQTLVLQVGGLVWGQSPHLVKNC